MDWRCTQSHSGCSLAFFLSFFNRCTKWLCQCTLKDDDGWLTRTCFNMKIMPWCIPDVEKQNTWGFKTIQIHGALPWLCRTVISEFDLAFFWLTVSRIMLPHPGKECKAGLEHSTMSNLYQSEEKWSCVYRSLMYYLRSFAIVKWCGLILIMFS